MTLASDPKHGILRYIGLATLIVYYSLWIRWISRDTPLSVHLAVICWPWDPSCWLWCPGCEILAVGSSLSAPSCQLLAVGSWLWDPGCGIAVVGSWLWDHGCGIIAVGFQGVGYWLWDPGPGILAPGSWRRSSEHQKHWRTMCFLCFLGGAPREGGKNFAFYNVFEPLVEQKLCVLLICVDFRDVWPTFGHIYSFLQGIRIWGQKMPNFRARREKLRKTNVNLCFSYFSVFYLTFLTFQLRVK